MDARNSQKLQAVRILVSLLTDGVSRCPVAVYGYPDKATLVDVARRNKVEHLLVHFTVCHFCRRQSSASFLRSIKRLRRRNITALFRSSVTRAALDREMARIGVRAVLIKDAPKEVSGQVVHVGNDLDILMTKSDGRKLAARLRKQGYHETHSGPRKEFQLKHRASGFEIDVHHLVAHPHFGDVREEELSKIRAFTEALLKTAPPGFSELSYPEYILMLCIRYWYNDMLCGMRDPFLIVRVVSGLSPDQQASLVRLARTYGMEQELSWLLLMASRIFGMPVISAVTRLGSDRTLLASYALSVYDLALFPAISEWHASVPSEAVRKRFRTYGMLRLIADSSVPAIRLVRPAVAGLFVACTVRIVRDILPGGWAARKSGIVKAA